MARVVHGRAWLPIAAALFAVGWGANQFPPMLLVYERHLGVGTGTLEAMFGLYALGLMPGLLVAGPLSDRIGRRPVVLPAVIVSLLASSVLMAGATPPLFAGRFLAGVASGAAFSAGTAWLREASVSPLGRATVQEAARRAAIAMTAGFAVGPLVAAAVAQFAPDPTTLPYLPHVAATAVVLAALAGAPETVVPSTHATARPRVPLSGAPLARFLRVVVPMAPWIFAAPAVAFALLPSVVGADDLRLGVVLGGAVTSLTAFAGIGAQPVARRLERRMAGGAGVVGLCLVAAGLAVGAITAAAHEPYLLAPSALVLGAAYGVCLVAGLIDVQHLAPAGEVAGLTARYYAVTYVGFATPYLLALAAALASYAALLAATAGLALATALVVARASARHPRPAAAPVPPRPPSRRCA